MSKQIEADKETVAAAALRLLLDELNPAHAEQVRRGNRTIEESTVDGAAVLRAISNALYYASPTPSTVEVADLVERAHAILAVPWFRRTPEDGSGKIIETDEPDKFAHAVLSALDRTREPQVEAVSEEQVERVARALCKAEDGGPIGHFPNGAPMRDGGVWEEYNERQHEDWRNSARAAIAAIKGAGV